VTANPIRELSRSLESHFQYRERQSLSKNLAPKARQPHQAWGNGPGFIVLQAASAENAIQFPEAGRGYGRAGSPLHAACRVQTTARTGVTRPTFTNLLPMDSLVWVNSSGFVSGADGTGDTEGKAATGSGERAGRPASFKFVSRLPMSEGFRVFRGHKSTANKGTTPRLSGSLLES